MMTTNKPATRLEKAIANLATCIMQTMVFMTACTCMTVVLFTVIGATQSTLRVFDLPTAAVLVSTILLAFMGLALFHCWVEMMTKAEWYD